ncbi:hypothetical protein [Myceligenerans xiligouense]|nr:hypothetical protein [Myceligenerans xiligouense]
MSLSREPEMRASSTMPVTTYLWKYSRIGSSYDPAGVQYTGMQRRVFVHGLTGLSLAVQSGVE